MSLNPHSFYTRCPEIESAPLEDECVLYHPGDNRFLRLNSTASFIWGRIETPATAEEVAVELLKSFRGVDRPKAVGDVREALEHMVSMSVVKALPPGAHRPQPQGDTR